MSDRAGYALGYLTGVELGPDIATYMARIESTFEPFGGFWLVHGSQPEVVEGDLPGTVVLIGFPSRDAASRWYFSPGYQEIVPLRTEHSHSIIAILDGVPAAYTAADTIAKLLSVS